MSAQSVARMQIGWSPWECQAHALRSRATRATTRSGRGLVRSTGRARSLRRSPPIGRRSVLEPAAFSTPVVFGPQFLASRDARLLLDEDAAVSVGDAGAAASAIGTWLFDVAARAIAGDAAQTVVRRGLGAAEKSFRLVRS